MIIGATVSEAQLEDDTFLAIDLIDRPIEADALGLQTANGGVEAAH